MAVVLVELNLILLHLLRKINKLYIKSTADKKVVQFQSWARLASHFNAGKTSDDMFRFIIFLIFELLLVCLLDWGLKSPSTILQSYN